MVGVRQRAKRARQAAGGADVDDDGGMMVGSQLVLYLQATTHRSKHENRHAKALGLQDCKTPGARRPLWEPNGFHDAQQNDTELQSCCQKYLIRLWAWGSLSPQQVQEISHHALVDCKAAREHDSVLDDLRKYAKIGSFGKYPNKCHEELLKKMPDSWMNPAHNITLPLQIKPTVRKEVKSNRSRKDTNATHTLV